MVSRVAELAAKLVDCAASDIIRVNGSGQLRITASSDPVLSGHTEQAWRQWPHTPLSANGPIDHTATMLQHSSYMQQLRVTGIVQELIVPLRAGTADHGYLRFLFIRPRAAATDRALISAMSAHAAIALDRAALLNQVDSLRTALDSSRRIGAAAGVVMARESLTYTQAAERLKTTSANFNRKLRDIADDVLLTGELPPAAGPEPLADDVRVPPGNA